MRNGATWHNYSCVCVLLETYLTKFKIFFFKTDGVLNKIKVS